MGKNNPMELADEAGFYAVLIPRKTVTAYTLLVTYDNGTEEEIHDPYSFGPQFTEEELKKFGAGIYYDIYEKMGAHPMTIDGIEGVYLQYGLHVHASLRQFGRLLSGICSVTRHRVNQANEQRKSHDLPAVFILPKRS